jgi:protein-tyrosine phosphatase
VCCGGGMSRSPALAAAALSVAFGESPEECLKAVVLHHPGDVSPGLWNEINAVLRTTPASAPGGVTAPSSPPP